MYVIKHQNGYYFHKKGKIILCNTQEEAKLLLNGFFNYSTARIMNERNGNPMDIFEVHGVINNFFIAEQDFIEEPPCGIIKFQDLGI